MTEAERDARGRFLPGNRCAKGNPHAKKVQQLRSTLMRSVTGSELRSIIKSLLAKAAGGDVHAAKLILDRTLGPPVALDLEERISRLEEVLENLRCTWNRECEGSNG